MSVAKVFSLDTARNQSQSHRAKKSYLEYLKLLNISELEKEVFFFIEHHSHDAASNPSLAMRGHCMMLEMAKRIDCEMMKAKVLEMADSLSLKLA